MSQHYSPPERAEDPYALPNIEIFHVAAKRPRYDFEGMEPGWYWWSCFPGCMPDGEPIGPFEAEAEAIADATQSE